jgi:2-dehydro-3-deoxygluconokinase
MRLVFAGECMIEMAPEGRLFHKGFAGDTLNMAWYARHLAPENWNIDFVSAIGADAISDEMAAFIASAGIGTDHLFRDPDRTVGLYMISLQDGERSFSYWRGQSAARQFAKDTARLDQSFKGADMVCISGITIAILDNTGRNNLATALARLRTDGGKVVFDPNIRPHLWASSGEMLETLTRFAALSDTVLASFDDEKTHFGDDSQQATLKRYIALGPSQVIVKDGAGPILGSNGGQTVTVQPEPVSNIIDTTAAGDSFNAGFLVQHLCKASLRESIEAGAAISRAVIQHRGALAIDAIEATRG